MILMKEDDALDSFIQRSNSKEKQELKYLINKQNLNKRISIML